MHNSTQTQEKSQGQNSSTDMMPPIVQYWHVWVDKEGVSHQSRCQMQDFILKSIAPPASPQWMGQLKQEGASVTFAVLPIGWVGTWHENPKPQWIIPLSGRWFVETMDGTRVEMGAGEISFGADQGTKPDAQGHQGHLSGTVGNEPCVMVIAQFEQSPMQNGICQ